MGQFDKAEAAAARAIALDGNVALYHAAHSHILKGLGRVQEAIVAASRAVELDPSLAQLHHQLAELLAEAGQIVEAEAASRQAIALDGGVAGYHGTHSHTLNRLGRVSEAVAAALRAIELDSGQVQVRRHLAAIRESRIAHIWQSTLRLDVLPQYDDNIFDFGADSLALTTMLSEVEGIFNKKVDVEAFFSNPTIEGLCLSMLDAESEKLDILATIPPGCEAITPEMLPLVELTSRDIERIADTVPGGAANIQDIYPLTPLQEGILFHHQMSTEGDPYLQCALYSFDSRNGLQRYLHALQAVIDRHDILRTAVLWEGLPEPVQVVWRQAPLAVENVSVTAADGDVGQQLRSRFDRWRYRLDLRQAPQTRVFVAHDGAKERWLILQLYHHISADAITADIVRQEIAAHLLDQAAHLPAPVRYRDFVAHARLGVSREEHKTFFQDMLGDVDEPTMPFGVTHVHGESSEIADAWQPVDASVTKRLRANASKLQVSVASLFHLAWAQVLARVSARDDVVFGTVLSGRMQAASGVERTPGPFINTLPLRVRVSNESVQDSVRSTHKRLTQLLRHEHASLALAQRCSALPAPTPLFSALLNYFRSDAADYVPTKTRQIFEGVQFLDLVNRNHYPLVLAVQDLGDGFVLTAKVQSAIDPRRVCAYMHNALERLVDALENTPTMPLRSLDIMPESERQRLWSTIHGSVSMNCLRPKLHAHPMQLRWCLRTGISPIAS